MRERLRSIATDASFALRLARRQKGWTAVIVLSLGLGMGATTALFSVIDSVLLKSLPVRAPGQLVALRWGGGASGEDLGLIEGPGATFPLTTFRAFREAAALPGSPVEEVFAFVSSMELRGEDGEVAAQLVSGNYYRALGVVPAGGRLLIEEDDRAGAQPVAVLSEGYWRRAFGGDPDVIGRTIVLNGVPAVVVGLAPAGLSNLRRPDQAMPEVTLALALRPALRGGAQTTQREEQAEGQQAEAAEAQEATDAQEEERKRQVRVMARKRPGVTDRQVQAALAGVVEQAVRADNLGPGSVLRVADARRGFDDVASGLARGLTLLSVVFGIVLAVIVVNLASLVLARGESRRSELAVRAAMGASRGRLVRQVLTESLTLAVLGGLAGLGAAYAALPWLPGALLSGHVVGMDLRTIGFSAGLVLLVGAVCGLPAVVRGGRALDHTMREASSGAPAHRARLAKSLVAVQVGLTLVLLVGAGLSVRTFLNLRRVPAGFDPDGLLLAGPLALVGGGANGYADAMQRYLLGLDNPEANARARAFYDTLLPRLQAVPEVRGVTYASDYSLLSLGQQGIFLDGARAEVSPQVVQVGEGFFQTIDIPLVEGRLFLPEDFGRGPPVVVVNETFARRFLEGGPRLGRRVSSFSFSESEIVGVVADVRNARPREPTLPAVYVPLTGRDLWRAQGLYVRHSGDPGAVAATLRNLITEADPRVMDPPAFDIRTQRSELESLYGDERYFAILSASFAAVVLGVAMIGLFGLMSWLVARRTREIGIRMALGAEAGRVRLSVLRESWTLMALGIALGLPAALAATRLIESRLFDVTPNDPVSVIGAAAVMLGVGTLAAWLPARRASGVDPLAALRHD